MSSMCEPEPEVQRQKGIPLVQKKNLAYIDNQQVQEFGWLVIEPLLLLDHYQVPTLSVSLGLQHRLMFRFAQW